VPALPPPPAVEAGLWPLKQLIRLIEERFRGLSRPVRKNLFLLVHAFITLTAALRSGYAALTLAAVARALPLGTSFRMRYKRLGRFLDNGLFDPQGLTEGLFAILLGLPTAESAIPVIIDQSRVGTAELLLAGIPQAGRILPLALMSFMYADLHRRPERDRSQNYLERIFFLRLLEATPARLQLVFILDRGYARVSLMRELLGQPQAFFILRARRNVVVERNKRGRRVRTRLGALRSPYGQVRRIEQVLYRGDKPVLVDVVLYYEPGHKERWYLVVPPGSSSRLSNEQVVALYRKRMQVEQGFRDFKTHLGVRGLRLQVRVSERVQRLLMAFTLAYALVVSLGMTRVAESARPRLEVPRAKDRHGTRRILSVRSVAALLLGGMCVELLRRLAATIDRLLGGVLRGRGLYRLAPRL
jgi:hypothetical protein